MSLNEKYEIQESPLYRISVCQDGKFAATFDAENLRIKILENTDHRSFTKKKDRAPITQNFSQQYEINRIVAHFKLSEDLSYGAECEPDFLNIDKFDNKSSLSRSSSLIAHDKWSLDISNLQKHESSNNEYYIYVAVSHIDIDKYMKGNVNNDTKNDYKERKVKKRECVSDVIIDIQSESEQGGIKKGTAIYQLKLTKQQEQYVLNDVSYYYSCKISGICRFVENSDHSKDKDYTSKRFLLLNFHGIYNFKCNDDFRLTEKFDYPSCIRRELDYWYKEVDCIDRLLLCIYNKYFLVRQYKNDVELLEVYDLEYMKLETTVKRVETENKCLGRHVFSISNLQLCFAQGLNSIGLYLIENGLEVASKKFYELKEIYLLEFIDSDEKLFIIGEGSEGKGKLKLLIWDLYKTGEIETIILDHFLTKEDLDTRLARTSGNLLQVIDNGKIISVLKKIENELCQKQSDAINDNFEKYLDLDTKLGEKSEGELDEHHIVHFNENTTPNFKPIVDEIEPWIVNNYERNSYCLYNDEMETLQLIVGRITVQIWHQIGDCDPFLEYIWISDVPVDQENEETRLHIKEFKYGSNNGSDHRLNGFHLKVNWHKNDSKIDKEEIAGHEKEMKEKIITWKDISAKTRAIRHACKALERLNKRRKCLANNYAKEQQYEKIVKFIKHIVWRFVRHEPDRFIMLDVRYNVLKNLILGDCDYLIKLVLFYDENNENGGCQIRHLPRSKPWPGKEFLKDAESSVDSDELHDNEEVKPENDMELAIYHCRNRELKDTIIIAYLLEYYSANATDYAGWMCTVSKSLPLLFKYNYDDYARKLFRKECFADQDYFSAQDPLEIIPKKFLSRRNHNIKFRAFRPIARLHSDKYKHKWYNIIYNSFKLFRRDVLKFSEDFDNHLGRSPLALRMVPLPKFTMNRIKRDEIEYDLKKLIISAIWFTFIPRWYKIGRNEKNKLSPFSNVVRFENNDDIYDNPATEAVIDFHWHHARNYFFFLFLRYLLFMFCFCYVSWDYVNQANDLESVSFALIILFYYLAAYLFAVEMIQLYFHGPRKYFGQVLNSFDMSNCFNLVSIILPVIVMSIMLKDFQISDGFGGVEQSDTGIITGISFSIFFYWIGAVSYLRLISFFAIYIYYMLIIFKAVFPFIIFMIIIVFAFAHSMFILLKGNIDLKDNTISGNATDNSTSYIYDVQLKNDFDVNDPNDNPYSNFLTALEATYFWMDGDYVQRDKFAFWAVDVFTLIASVILAIILQNMLIAFMGGVYERTEAKGRQALLRFRANHIAEYEALNHMHLWNPDLEPKYIYYIGQSQNFEEWYKNGKKDQGEIFKDFEEKCTYLKRVYSASSFKKDGPEDEFSIWKYGEKKNKKVEKTLTNKSSKIIISEKRFIQEKTEDEFQEIKRMIEIF